jgi:nucleoside-diphosphate-sugar epimerase
LETTATILDGSIMADTVLVTGVTGFIGGHIAAELLRRGYAVRGSLRSPGRTDEVRAAMAEAGADDELLEIRQLDLLSDEGWSEAAAGCRYVIHVASPFSTTEPDDPEDMIRPAVEGTRRAVTAALDAGVERVVLTSSGATVENAAVPTDHVFTSSDWTDPTTPGLGAYTVSKVRAEQTAWDIVEKRSARDRLAVIIPGAVIGPLLSADPGTSVSALQQILSGSIPVIPDLRFPWVDVRDIAEAHINAMTDGSAAGNRTIVASDTSSLRDAATVLRKRLPADSRRLSRIVLPTWATRLASVFEPQLRANRGIIGVVHRFDRAPAEALLGHPLRPAPETIVETGRSLVRHGLV